MLPDKLIKGFDRHRLRKLLALIFLALAVPTAVLIWQAYSQLKWEAFHQTRGVAEELTGRIDARLIDMINTADARSFADYAFLVVTGDPSANFVQRSPLSEYPVDKDLPGVLGYFQVDTAGAFSTPLLPPARTAAEQFGIDTDEYADRLQLAREIQAVLADNRLIRSRPEIGIDRELAPVPESPRAVLQEEEKEADEYRSLGSPARKPDTALEAPATVTSESFEGARGGFVDEMSTDKDSTADVADYSQRIFDKLNMPDDSSAAPAGTAGMPAANEGSGEAMQTAQALKTIGKVSDLKLDSDLQKKSERVERDDAKAQGRDDGRVAARSKRREQIALPESVAPIGGAVAERQVAAKPSTALAADLRISTFESEIDPLEFSLLDSGHFVLFRKVWRDGERYIQGLLIDQDAFARATIGERFTEIGLSDAANLIVAYQDDVIYSISDRVVINSYPNGNDAFNGALLYRNRLSAPLDSLELIYSIRRLPPGPGAGVLGWVTVVLAIVFVGGFGILYRLGTSQIDLARQQQDFVSAVNHELKTPLTSIRMYGEMLKEGWADEEKRQSYYEFIHDESERLTRLISNVLQLAQITRNEPQFDLKPTRVDTLISNIESKIASQVERAGFELRFARDEQAGRAAIMIDEDCFAQIVINLVDNAIKFSRDADTKAIEISSKLTGDDGVVFSVRDFGPGIPGDQMKKIFKLFYRSESELTRETVGTGIGLAIVHQLTLAMNGTIDVVNRQPGAEFAVSFSTHR